jgi:hypothetical protein
MLKERSGRGFDQLGRQAGMSGSSLHRYCSGLTVPSDYRVVYAFAKVCGASRDEMRDLHRLWALADASRENGSVPAPDGADTVADTVPVSFPAELVAVTPVAVEAVAVAPVAAAEPAAGRRWTARRLYRVVPAAIAGTVLVGVLAWAVSARAVLPSNAADADGRLLFSPACQPTVSMGEHDECVREVQTLLLRAGGRLAVDGDFGPETLRRVTAFQVLAGLPPKGVVDDRTKKALYDQRVTMATWAPAEVEKRIREVFPEEPDRAVAIARCQSFLDPLWVLPNTNGTRNWGVFQISDVRLAELGGTPLLAYDPDWNIQAARRLWSVRHDFHDWPACDAARTGASASAGPVTSPPPGQPLKP